MSDDRPRGDGPDPTNPYGQPGRGPAGEPGVEPGRAARPHDAASGERGPYGAAGDPQRETPRQDPQWQSATQRREHPEGGAPGSAAPWTQPGQNQRGIPVVRRRAGAGSAFLVALIATLIGLAVSLVASYVADHRHSMSIYPRTNLLIGGLAPWPSSGLRAASDINLNAGTGHFVLAFAVAGVVLLLLLWAALASTPGRRGFLTVLLAGWGATVVAGAVALGVEYLAISHHGPLGRLFTLAVSSGADWGIRVGWVVGVIAALGHVLRRPDRLEV
ncbi:hypothetical protein [Allobranchiibius sp. GilTou38]|uniref:hypothetical protein n=1 Tax=Allobranchiibius sp. GilTou38 TaxID=2815210 RepID=UPI001AA1A280|nr:hypothetical protein [Allobranchiibius sp. GilTou38]MBO1767993.1 hypothetical protein [Allobranchiibius sp. GilTou38]